MDDVRIAIYIRLSMADEETGRSRDESNSVVNQRSLIHRFLDNNEELCNYPRTEFVDDGFTGTNTDRPAFQRMINRIRDGQFNFCISKDFSRFSRDYIEMGDYLECLFPFLNVRYISINDNYDSRDYKGTTGGLDVVMRTIVYDAYSKDLSMKERTGKLQSRKKGRRAAGDPPFGYMKDPDNKAMNIIDPEASVIVRRIFDEALAGKKPGDIARGLNEDGVITPGRYFREKYPDNKRFGNISERQAWDYYKVHVILRRLTYTGAAVGGLRKQLMPCKKVTTQVSREDWVVVPDMHEAIITAEEYEQAQQVIGSGEAHNKNIVMYPMRSLIYCGYCGRHMIRYKATKRFNCPYGRNGGNGECKGHRSPVESEIEKIVFQAIRDFISMSEGKRRSDRNRIKKNRSETKSRKLSIGELETRITVLKHDKLALYEKYCDGDMDKMAYLHEKGAIDTTLRECEESIKSHKAEIEDSMGEETLISSEADAVCEAFKDVNELTYDMAHAFVEKIIVYRDDRLDIVWRFKDYTTDDAKENV